MLNNYYPQYKYNMFYLIIILVILLVFAILLPNKENFHYATHTQYPFWNIMLGNTRNMSYDLRGDPMHYHYNNPYPKHKYRKHAKLLHYKYPSNYGGYPWFKYSPVGPWNISSFRPIHNKPLYYAS